MIRSLFYTGNADMHEGYNCWKNRDSKRIIKVSVKWLGKFKQRTASKQTTMTTTAKHFTR